MILVFCERGLINVSFARFLTKGKIRIEIVTSVIEILNLSILFLRCI